MFINFAISSMGKLAFVLCFILSVFPADVNENRRHIHVIRRGDKKTHKGDTVAKIWIEKNGRKDIEVAWSELSSADEVVVLKAIDDNWASLNRSIEKVFAGRKVHIKKLK